MPISPVTPVLPPSPLERQAAHLEAASARNNAATEKKVPWQPAPAIRPTIEDRIDIDRALITLRTG